MFPNHVYGKLFYGYTMMAIGTELALHGGGVEIRSLSFVDILSCFILFLLLQLNASGGYPSYPKKTSSAPDGNKAGQNNGSVSFSPWKS